MLEMGSLELFPWAGLQRPSTWSHARITGMSHQCLAIPSLF
jgi:hypothetical protein